MLEEGKTENQSTHDHLRTVQRRKRP